MLISTEKYFLKNYGGSVDRVSTSELTEWRIGDPEEVEHCFLHSDNYGLDNVADFIMAKLKLWSERESLIPGQESRDELFFRSIRYRIRFELVENSKKDSLLDELPDQCLAYLLGIVNFSDSYSCYVDSKFFAHDGSFLISQKSTLVNYYYLENYL